MGVSIDFEHKPILKHFKAFSRGTDSFGGILNPQTLLNTFMVAIIAVVFWMPPVLTGILTLELIRRSWI